MSQQDPPEDLVLSEAQLREIIDVASRGAPQADGVTVAQLRQIAAELEISEDALRHAMNQVLVAPAPVAPPPVKQSLRSRVLNFVDPGRWMALSLIGGGLGVFTALVESAVLDRVVNGIITRNGSGAFIDFPVAAVMLILTYANSRTRSADGQRNRYISETIATWGAFALGWSTAHGHMSSDLLWFVATCMAVCSAWGWLIIEPPKHGPVPASADIAQADEVVHDPSAERSDTTRFFRARLFPASQGL